MSDSLSFWTAVSGWLLTMIAGAIWVGRQQQRIDQHQKIAESCHLGELMTETKCQKMHDQRQETTEVILEQIKKSLDVMARDIRQLSDSQHQRQVDFARMGEQLKNVVEKVNSWDSLISQVNNGK